VASPTAEAIKELWDVHTGNEATAARNFRADILDPTRDWVEPGKGYRLSDRLWQGSQAVRSQIDELLRDAIRTGEDALLTAKKLEQFLSPDFSPIRTVKGRLVRNQNRSIVTSSPGRGGMGSFPARRLARTEISRVHGGATIYAAERTPFAKGVKWNLSGRHPKADICNQHAERNSGFGPGVYAPKDVPRYPEHPQDLCHLSVVTEENVDAIVTSLRDQYGLDEAVSAEQIETSHNPVAPVAYAFDLPPEWNDFMKRAMAIRGDINVREVAEEGVRAIDRVHKDGVLPRIPVRVDFDQFSRTAAKFEFNSVTGQPVAIGVNSLKQFKMTAHESFVHEVGHFLDFSGIGTPGKFATHDDPLMDGWRLAVSRSRAVQQLESDLVAGVRKIPMPGGTVRDYPVDQKYITYLLGREEVWARSYSQYITRKSKDPDLIRAFEETRQTSMYKNAWDDDDFQDIEDAIDALFRTLGWMP